MKAVQIVFSPTGGTQKAADCIMKNWNVSTIKADLTNPLEDFSDLCLTREDAVLIAVPSYMGRVPALAAERISKIRGGQALCVLVCVYGNRAYEDTLIELKDLAEQCDFRIAAAISAIAEHSIMHQYAAGRPDKEDEEELASFGAEIFDKIIHFDAGAALPSIPGTRPYKKAGGAALIPKADDLCIRCGVCADKCPAQAISRENPQATDSQKCISCMRCVVQCPKSARKVSRAKVSAISLALKKACSGRKENELFI